jgi:hypothetical protein
MKRTIINIIICAFAIILTNSMFAQTKTIEERLSDLEKRVQALEAKLGTSSQTTQPSTKTQNNQPSNDLITNSIKALLKKEVPATWSGSLMGGKNASVDLIEVQQIGNYNDQGRYWPIKCHVKGSCDADFLLKTERRNFDKIGDFKLRQDDYGNWYAEIDTF